MNPYLNTRKHTDLHVIKRLHKWLCYILYIYIYIYIVYIYIMTFFKGTLSRLFL